MDRKPAPKLVCSRGVAIRQFKHERRIQIAFSYRAVECRELLAPGPVTQTAVNYAAGMRAEVVRKIATGEFHYPDYFPSRDPLHNSLRSVVARARAVRGVVFLANSPAIGKKRRLVAHPDPRITVPPELCRGSLARALSSLTSAASASC